MTAIRYRLAAQLRGSLASTALLVAAVALAGGFVLTCAVGARRTATALDRMASDARSGDVVVSPAPDPEELTRFPEVIAAGRLTYVLAEFPDYRDGGAKIVPFAMGDDAMLRTVDRGRLLLGHRPIPNRPDEVLVSPGMAARRHLRPGSPVRIRLATPTDVETIFRGGAANASGPVVDASVAGVLRQPLDLAQDPSDQDVLYLGGQETIYLPSAFFRAHVEPMFGSEILRQGGTSVRLRRGAADLERLQAHLDRAVLTSFPPGTSVQVTPAADSIGAAARAIHVQAVAMWALTAGAALTVLLLVGQTLSRHSNAEAHELGILRAIGMTGGQLQSAAILRAALVTTAGTLGSIGVAIVASPLTPAGLARQAEPHNGVVVNAAVLAAGAVVMVLLLLAWVLPGTRRATREAAGTRQPGRRTPVVGAIGRWGLPASATSGIAMALEPGHGPSQVPVRSTVVTIILAVATLTAALAFGNSLHSLARTPSDYGWDFDVAVGNPNTNVVGDVNAGTIGEQAARVLSIDPDVAAYTGIAFADVNMAGRTLRAMGIDTTHGTALPTLVDGRQPAADDEVAMTGSALRATRRTVGQTVTVRSQAGRGRFRIVGEIAAPANALSQTQSGRSIELPMRSLSRLQPGVVTAIYFVRYRTGVVRGVALGRLRRKVGPIVLQAIRPAEVQNLVRISWMPWALAAFLTVVGVGTLAHLLVSSVRRRRHDLAILKAIGFSKRQVSATFTWQASAIVTTALVVGVPIGVAAGRSAWSVVASRADVVDRPVVPAVALTLTALLAIVIAILAAAVPAWMAARTPPGRLLQAE